MMTDPRCVVTLPPTLSSLPVAWSRMPTNWSCMSVASRKQMLSDYVNNLALVKMGLLSGDTIDLSYLNVNDARGRKRKFEDTTYVNEVVDEIVESLF